MFFFKRSDDQGWGGTPYNGLYGETERDIFFRLQVCERDFTS